MHSIHHDEAGRNTADKAVSEPTPVVPGNIPAELKDRDQWVGWVYEERGGKPTKVPVNPRTGGNASPTDPGTWGTFESAFSMVGCKVRGGVPVRGVGFVLTAGDPYVGYDLDGVRDPGSGEIEPWALREVRRLGSYAEVSPSGRGIRVVGRGSLPGRGGPRMTRDGHALEVYDRERFLTLTGHILKPEDTKEVQDDQ